MVEKKVKTTVKKTPLPRVARVKKEQAVEQPQEKYRAVGRRKEAIARVLLHSGTGQFIVNEKSVERYFPSFELLQSVQAPLVQTNLRETLDVSAKVIGGGFRGQADAVRHGISRALLKTDEKLRQVLRKHGLLTRDPRMKERKKYGQKGARARFQFSKR